MAAFEDVQLRIDEPDETGVGEVLARGPNIMAGYYKNPKATSEVIDE
jgi:long-chain acyl-CoA synthetase